MKKITAIAIILSVLMLSACSGKNEPSTHQNDTEVTTTAAKEAEQYSTADEITEAADSVTSTEETSAAEPIQKGEYTDENGLLTQKAVEQIDKILNDNKTDTEQYYTGLYDFDLDGVPEVYLVRHNSGQGLMPVDVYNIDGTYLGGFEGYCRDGYTRLSTYDGSVYVHNFYEHSNHQRLNQIDRITLSEGKLDRTLYFEAYAVAGSNYPLLETVDYYLENEEESYGYEEGRDHRFDYDNGDIYLTENAVSICAYDFSDRVSYEEMAGKTAEVYNLYIKGKGEAQKLFQADRDTDFLGEAFFVFDDFDGNGNYEAFSYVKGGNYIYFWNGSDFEKIEASLNWHYRVGNLFIAQGGGNGSPCSIFGVKNGVWFESEISKWGMCVEPLLGPETGTFLLHQSKYDANSLGGGHTWKPFMFYDSGEEIVDESVPREELVNRNQGDKLLAEIERLESDDYIVCEIFCFLDRYYVVNYIMESWGENENGDLVHYMDRNYYNRYFAENTFAVLEEQGQGRYVGGSIREK